jgi:RHS repeat-associated protein
MMEAKDVADVDNDANTTELVRLYYHYDSRGNVARLTAAAQTVVEAYEYDPYGNVSIKDKSGGGVSATQIGNPFDFQRRRRDNESGLLYFRARHYDPGAGHWLQRDPAGLADTSNTHEMERSNAPYWNDPFGLASGAEHTSMTHEAMDGIYEPDFIDGVIKANLAMDTHNDLADYWRHWQTIWGTPQSVVDTVCSGMTDWYVDKAADAYVEGDMTMAEFYLGSPLHMVQDQPFHAGEDMTFTHAGCGSVGAIFRQFIGFVFNPFATLAAALNDLFPPAAVRNQAVLNTLKILIQFQKAVEEKKKKKKPDPPPTTFYETPLDPIVNYFRMPGCGMPAGAGADGVRESVEPLEGSRIMGLAAGGGS